MCVCVCVWIYNEKYGEKARWEQAKNATYSTLIGHLPTPTLKTTQVKLLRDAGYGW